jgi:hypothetical protein
MLLRYTHERFLKYWDGYVVEPSGISWGQWLIVGSVVILDVLGIFGFVAWRKRVAQSATMTRTGKMLLTLCLGWFMQLASVSTAMAFEKPPIAAFGGNLWRTPNADSVNCVYLQMRLLGHGVDYATLKQSVHADEVGTSLGMLKEVTGRCGLQTRILRCAPSELAKLPMPAIAHMEDQRTGGGRFVLLFTAGKESYGIIDGTTATIEELSADEFLREWSGYVLIADSEAPQQWMLSLGAGILAIAMYAWWRIRGSLERFGS